MSSPSYASSILVPPATLTPTLTFTPTTSISSASASSFTILDANASVNDGGNRLGAIRVSLGTGTGSLGVVDSGGVLNVQGTLGAIAYQYDPTRQVLSLTDNTSGQTASSVDFTQALKRVGYSAGSTTIGASQDVSVNLGRPVFSSANGHYYEFVRYDASAAPATKTWTVANGAASDKNFLGLTGYLTTVTSASENKFMNDRIKETGWIGGSSSGTTGTSRVWKWVVGPELGTIFWNGNEPVNGGSAVAGQYTNWAANEPNNFNILTNGPSDVGNNEPYAHFFTNGTWNDFADNNTSLQGYWVEYSTATGLGDDGLGGTRKNFNVTVTDPSATGTQDPKALDLVFYNPVNGQISFAFIGTENNIVKPGLGVTEDTPNLIRNGNLAGPTESGIVYKLLSAEVDVDKDGIKDFIIRNSTNGEVAVLFGEDRTTTKRGSAYNRYAFVESGGQTLTNTQDWTIDFASNKLGANNTAGVLWRNAGNGNSGVTSLVATADTTKVGGMKVVNTVNGLLVNVGASSGWYSVGDGEFNANSTTREVLWRNSRTNEVVVWSFNTARNALADAKLVSFGGVGGRVGSEWKVVGIADVEPGGNDEIVWQKGVDVAFWKMAANNYSSGARVTVGAGDRLKAIADVDKDGVLDLIGQNDTDGTVGFYTLTSALAKKADRVTYTASKAAYKPGRGAGNAGLELVNVSQYDTIVVPS